MKTAQYKQLVKVAQISLLAGIILSSVPALAVIDNVKIISFKGTVKFRPCPSASNNSCGRNPSEQGAFNPVVENLILDYSDKLYLGQSSEITLYCPTPISNPGDRPQPNHQRRTTSQLDKNPTEVNKICPALSRDSGRYISSRLGGLDKRVPYIISPRYSQLLSDRPIIRWNLVGSNQPYKVDASQSYTVELFQQGDQEGNPICSIKDQRATQMDISRGFKELQFSELCSQNSSLSFEKRNYVVVTASNGKSSEEEVSNPGYKLDQDYKPELRGVSGLEFTVATSEKAQFVKQKGRSMLEFERALYYAAQHFYSEAIQILVSLPSKTATTQRILGDFYAESGLNQMAENAYVEAIRLAENNPQNKEELKLEKALAEHHLGKMLLKITQAKINSEIDKQNNQRCQAATKYLTSAVQSYQVINKNWASEAEQLLKSIKCDTLANP